MLRITRQRERVSAQCREVEGVRDAARYTVRKCTVGAAPGGGSGSNEGENMSRRSAGRLKGFGTLRMGTREVSVPAVSMARRRIERL